MTDFLMLLLLSVVVSCPFFSLTTTQTHSKMIKTSVTGKVFKIFKSEKFSDKFSKRNLIIETKEKYNPHVSIDFINARIDLLRPIKEGQTVTVFVDVYSRPSASNPDKFFNNITGWKIEHEHDEFVPEMDDVPSPEDMDSELPF